MAHNLTSLAFTTEKTDFQCSAIPYGCDPPSSACARDPDTGRSFCCDRHDDGNLCWNDIAACASDGSTFTCERSGYTWCCMSERELCDPTRPNACISTVRNPLLDVDVPALSKAYSSLSAAQPDATYLSFDPLALAAPAVEPPAQSTSTSAPPPSPTKQSDIPSGTATPPPGNTVSAPESSSRDGLSGGAIAGIVIGAVVAVLLGLLVWILWRRQRRLEGGARSSAGASAAGMEPVHKRHSELPPSYGGRSPAETTSGHGYYTSELPVRQYGHGPSELPVQQHGYGASELHASSPLPPHTAEAPTYSTR